jgi:hypothetical protein
MARNGHFMEPSIKKAGSGKTVRVATTFTGAAACAFAFAPTALEGTPQQAAQPGHQGRQVRVNTHAIPYIETGNCRGAGQSHWFHMGSESNVTCFGFPGTDYFSPVPIRRTRVPANRAVNQDRTQRPRSYETQ